MSEGVSLNLKLSLSMVLLEAFLLFLCLHETCCSPLDYLKGSLLTDEKSDDMIPEISPSGSPQPFLPFLAPSPLAPFTNSTVPKLSGLCMLNPFTAAMATVMRARPKDFLAVKQEWAAIRIQTTFRGFLARQALRALRAVVRIQAIFRGRQVRKQAAVTLRCMQALVRVQERVRSQSVKTVSEGQEDMQKLLNDNRSQADPIKHAEQGWCDSPGTVDEVRAKIQMRQEGAIKRERVIAYSRSQNQSGSCASPNPRMSKAVSSVKHHHKLDNNNGLSWVERWMAAKPWESRLMEELSTEPSETTPYSLKSDDHIFSHHSYSSEYDSIKVRRNNVTTKVSARPPMVGHIACLSSDPSSESIYDERSTPTSSISVSPIPMSNNLRVECLETTCNYKPSYMNLTQSTKAKLRMSQHSSINTQRNVMDDLQSHRKYTSLSSDNARSSWGSNPSSKLCKDLYPPIPLGRPDWASNWQHNVTDIRGLTLRD